MDGMFEEWVREMAKKFVSEGRKVVLVIINCPAHPILKIDQFFSSPNTTHTHKIDHNVICSLKAQYHKNVAHKIIRNVGKKKLPKIYLLLGMQRLVAT